MLSLLLAVVGLVAWLQQPSPSPAANQVPGLSPALERRVPAVQASYRHRHHRKPHHSKPVVIVLDPGHGGWASGAVHVMPNGHVDNMEKWVTLKIAKLAAADLRHAGFTVFLTRTRDQAVNQGKNQYHPTGDQGVDELESRVLFSNRHHAKIFVSMHINGSSSSTAKGLTVYYCPAHRFARSNLRLARSLDGAIAGSLKKVHYSPYNWGMHTDVSDIVPQHFADYPYFLQIGPADKRDHLIENKAVSALGETLFITNWHEDSLLKRRYILKAIAWGYTRGIEHYLHP